MSYILDALKKSEQERGHGTTPTVQTLHSTGLNYPSNKTHLWPYILLAAIVINLAALLYFIITGSKVDPAAQTRYVTAETGGAEAGSAQVRISRQAAKIPVTDSADEVVYKPVLMPTTRQAVAQETRQATIIKYVPVEPVPANTLRTTVLERDELPVDTQQHIPIMEFSAHVYSTNPLQRSMVINGRFMEEGDSFASDLFLSEITPDGAIFDFQGQLFHQRVVSAWN